MEVNPTNLIIEHLKAELVDENIIYDILETSIQGVDKFHSSLEEESNDCHAYFIHLGVSSTATCFNLENIGYNCMNFRVPDEQGNQPENKCIAADKELEGQMRTALDLEDMKKNLESLRADGLGDVCISTDPGRFLCNYVYFQSLCHCSSEACQPATAGDCTRTALFVHVPPVELVPLETQIDFVRRMIEYLKKKQTCVG